MKYILILVLMVQLGFSSERFKDLITGDEFNVILLTPNIEHSDRKKTSKAIIQGYNTQNDALDRTIGRNNYSSLLKRPYRDKKYHKADKLVDKELKEMLSTMESAYGDQAKAEAEVAKKVDGDDDSMSFDTDDFSDDSSKTAGTKSLNEIFTDTYFKIGVLYYQEHKGEWINIGDVRVPYYTTKGAIPIKIQGVFGEVFYPSNEGRVHTMSIRIFFIILNSDGKDVTVMTKTIKKFIWNRNKRYISAVTGQVLREILSDALNKEIK